MIIYEEILREFQKEKVKYAIVGGLAVNLLGGMRTTADLDILVEMSNVNLAKVVKVLKKRGFTVRQPVDPMGIANEKIREDWIKNKHMKAFNFYKDMDFQEVDIIIDSPVTFEEAKKKIIRVRVADLNLPVVAISDLIKMKKRAGRMVDQADIRSLKNIQSLRKKK